MGWTSDAAQGLTPVRPRRRRVPPEPQYDEWGDEIVVENAEDGESGDDSFSEDELPVSGEEMDEEEVKQLGVVSAPLFPKEKREGWWIVVGDTTSNTLHALKRVNLVQRQKAVLEFLAPEEAGDYNLTLFCMSDSYLGCDQEYSVPLSVAAGDDESESGSESSGEE